MRASPHQSMQPPHYVPKHVWPFIGEDFPHPPLLCLEQHCCASARAPCLFWCPPTPALEAPEELLLLEPVCECVCASARVCVRASVFLLCLSDSSTLPVG